MSLFSSGITSHSDQPNNFDYNKAWEEVNRLVDQEGKVSTAAVKLEEIYKNAFNDKNVEEQYAAIQYKVNKLIKSNTETLDYLNKELDKSTGLLKSMLTALRGDFYAIQNNQRNYRGDTDLANDESTDIESMSRNGLVKAMMLNYSEALSNSELHKIPFARFKRSIVDGDSLYFEVGATLYDVLALRFISHLDTDLGIDGIADFNFTPTELLGKLPDFLKLSFIEDQNSYLHLAGSTFQNILKNLNNPMLRFVVDKRRLNYFGEKYGSEKYSADIINALDFHIENNSDKDVKVIATITQISYKIDKKENFAVLHAELVSLKNKYPSSKYLTNIQAYIDLTESSELEVKALEVYSSKQRKYINLKYFNLPNVIIEIARVEGSVEEKIKLLNGNYNNTPANVEFKTQKKLEVKLDSEKYKYKYTSIELGMLTYGLYEIKVNDGIGKHLKTAYIQISDLTAIKINQINKLHIHNRMSGLPLKDVKVSFFTNSYNRESRIYEFVKSKSYSSNTNGEATVDLTNESYMTVITKDDDQYIIRDNIYFGQEYVNSQQASSRNLIFTDRSIYRPGQTVYYKIISFNGKNNDYKVAVGKNIDMLVSDVNGGEVLKITNQKTNSFGSHSGSFTLPVGRLNGNFSIALENDFHTFVVEKYKRPSFEAKEVSAQIGKTRQDITSVVFKAEGLAGNVLNDIDYTYSIERSEDRPRCYSWWPMENNWYTIKKGEGRTDKEGKAAIDFFDKSTIYTQDKYSMLSYKLSIKFTDQSGESAELTKTISFSDQEFYLNIESKDVIQVSDRSKSIKVMAFTANNDTVKTDGKINVYQLSSKDPLAFQNYSNNNGLIPEYNIKSLKLVKTVNFKSGEFVDLKLESGNYLMVAVSTTKSGKEIVFQKEVNLIDFDKGIFGTNRLIFDRISQNTAEPGQKVVLDLGSSFPMKGRLIIMRGNEIIFNQLTDMNPTTCMTYNVKEEDRGGINFYYFGLYNNTFYNGSVALEVPWSNKHLDIKYESIRNLILPGSKEKHTITVSSKDPKAAVEVLSALYDASLDFLQIHNWNYGLYNRNYGYLNANFFGYNETYFRSDYSEVTYPEYINLGDNIPNILYFGQDYVVMPRAMMSKSAMPEVNKSEYDTFDFEKNSTKDALNSKVAGVAVKPFNENKVRENLKETVFFYPNLIKDASGKVSYEFTMNEALTRWRLMTLAHSKDMQLGYKETYITTQKDLMIKANKPRILRFNDKVFLTANVSNLTDKPMEVQVNLDLANHLTDLPVEWSKNKSQKISMVPKSTQGVSWLIQVPDVTDVEILSFVVSASSATHTDAEKDIIPISPDKIWITHALPFHLGGNEAGEYKIPLFGSDVSQRKHTIEINTNPAWIAFASLPALDISNPRYATEFMARLYQYSMAREILNANPEFKKLLQSIPNQPSKLTQNQELKNMLLEATPFVRAAKGEELNYESMKKYLDNNAVAKVIQDDIEAIKNQQNYDGGFTYNLGTPSNLYTTSQILQNIIELEDAKIFNKSTFQDLKQRASDYLLVKLEESYQQLKSRNLLGKDGGGSYIDELYILSKEGRINELKTVPSVKYYLDGVSKNWLSSSIVLKVKIAYIANSIGDIKTSNLIKAYFNENKVTTKELGTYWEEEAWKTWRRLSIAEHSALINFYFSNGASDAEIDQMKIWLLKNKQVQGWPSYENTSKAIYALMKVGSKKEMSMIKAKPDVSFSEITNPFDLASNTVGLIKEETNTDLAGKTMRAKNNSNHIIYGGLFTSFYQKADKIQKPSNSPFSISKEFYREIKSKFGDKLEKVTSTTLIAPGDAIVSRIILKLDRDMDYLTLTDTRPSGFEPIKDKSFKGWYNNYTADITDYQANYFFFHLQKGTHVMENKVIAVHKGEFMGGIARFQSYYSPEFVSYTEGTRVEVK